MNQCRGCAASGPELLLDLGGQPLCNRYRRPGDGEEYLHGLALSQCGACGLLQIADAIPPEEMRPRLEWITYREPEAHLDAFADLIRSEVGARQPRSALGLSFKDDPLLDRLKARGMESVRRLEPVSDLGAGPYQGGVESLQHLVDGPASERVARATGTFGVVIARHILEHAHDIPRFLGALNTLVHPEGFIVLELPDCTRALEAYDYSTIWEEHVSYFTESCLSAALARNSYSILRMARYPYPMEDVFAVLLRRGSASAPAALGARGDLGGDLRSARRFANALDAIRKGVQNHVDSVSATGGGVALFGAGHRAALFINVMGLGSRLAFVVDDDPNKAGMLMPGSGLPIVPSASLLKQGIRLCLLSVSPEAEDRVLARNHAFVEAGGRFESIYPFSRLGLPLQKMAEGRPG